MSTKSERSPLRFASETVSTDLLGPIGEEFAARPYSNVVFTVTAKYDEDSDTYQVVLSH